MHWSWTMVSAVAGAMLGMVVMCVVSAGTETGRQKELAEAKRKAAAYKRLWEKVKCQI